MLWYVNPSRKRRTSRRNPSSFTPKGERMYRHVARSYGHAPRAKEIAARTVYARSRYTPGLRRPAKNPKRRPKPKYRYVGGAWGSPRRRVPYKALRTPRRKLYGAALAARLKKLAKLSRKRKRKTTSTPARKPNTARKRHTTTTRRIAMAKRKRRRRAKARRNPVKHVRKVRRRRRRNPSHRRKLYGAALKAHRKAMRRGKKRSNPRRRVHHRRRYRRNPAGDVSASMALSEKAGRRSRRKGKRRHTGLKAAKRARRTIRYQARRKRGPGYSYIKKHRMRANPLMGDLMAVGKAVIPVAASLYLTRFVTKNYGGSIPGLSSLGNFAQPALAAAFLVAAHFATDKVGFLKKHRAGIMIGVGINLVDSLFRALAPASVLTQVGLSDYIQIGPGAGIGEYITTGLETDMGEYIEVGAEEDLGALQEELGDAAAQPAMTAPVPQTAMVATVPNQSYTRTVNRPGPGFDKRDTVYTGLFAGGFGN